MDEQDQSAQALRSRGGAIVAWLKRCSGQRSRRRLNDPLRARQNGRKRRVPHGRKNRFHPRCVVALRVGRLAAATLDSRVRRVLMRGGSGPGRTPILRGFVI